MDSTSRTARSRSAGGPDVATRDTDPTEADQLESLVERQAKTLDRQERLISALRATVADQRASIDDLRTRLDSAESSGVDVPVSRRGVLKAGGLLGLVGVGVGPASAEPTGQIGTADRPLETLYTAGLDGPLTDGQELTSLVGDGLTVEDGALTNALDVADLAVTGFDVGPVRPSTDFTVAVTLEETAGVGTRGLGVRLEIAAADGTTVYDQSVDASELAGASRTITFGTDGGTDRVGPLDAGKYDATVTVTATNAATTTATDEVRSTDADLIETWQDLDAVRTDLTGEYALAADLDVTSPGYHEVAGGSANGGDGFVPLGDADEGFSGTFYGSGYEIRGLTVDRPAAGSGEYGEDAGLFGHIASGGTVSGVTLVDASVVAGDGGDGSNSSGYSGGDAGALAGRNDGEVTDSSVRGSAVTSGDGGDSGDPYGGNPGTVGALVGYNAGTVRRSVGLDSRVATGDGGDGTDGGNVNDLGGLVGTNDGTVHTSFTGGGVTLEFGTPGSGDSGDGEKETAGGLVGLNSGTVQDSYATADVTGGSTLGGLVGDNDAVGTVERSFSTGSVTGDIGAGGLVGYNNNVVTDSFWDYTNSESLDENDGIGYDNEGTGDVTGLSTAEMQGAEAADNMPDLDFTDVWATVDAETDAGVSADDYPVLRALDRETQLEAKR